MMWLRGLCIAIKKTGLLGQKRTVGARGIFGFSTTVGVCVEQSTLALYEAKIETSWAFKEQFALPEIQRNLGRPSPSFRALSSSRRPFFALDWKSLRPLYLPRLLFCENSSIPEGVFLARRV